MKKPLKILLFWLLTSSMVNAQSPNVASISKVDGTLNAPIGISGSNFSTTTGNLAVWFGGMKGNVIQATENFAEVAVPPGATTSSISVTNTTTGLTGYSSDIFNLNFSGAPGSFDVNNLDIKQFDSFEEIFDLVVCDFDLDGLNDVAASKIGTNSGDIVVFQNISTGNAIDFTLLNKITNPEFDIKNPTSNVGFGDIDGDGKVDLVATRSVPTANQIYVWRNTSTPGTITFANQKSYFIPAGEVAKIVKVRDLDGDGKPELVVANNEENTIITFQNTSTKGNINFNFSPITIQVAGAASTNGLDVEDLNNDGKAEIITNPLFESNVFVLENLSTKGNFIFSDPIVLNLSGGLNSLVVGDINRDGKSDIVITKTQESKIGIFLNNSDTDIQFQNVVEFDTGLRPWGLDMGDLNGDGLLDIVTTSINSDEATFFENKSTDAVVDFDISVVPQEFRTRNIKIGDLSGDAKPDIALTGFDFGTNEFRLITVRSTHCCKATILNPPESICNGQTIRLNATPALFVDYVWRKDGVEVKNSQDPFLDITLPGAYHVNTISEGTSCSETSQDFIITLGTGNLPPDIENTASNDGPVCPGETINLSIETVTDATYLWAGPMDFTSTEQNPALTNVVPEMVGNYFATVFLGDCQSFPASTLVELIVPPDFSIQASGPTRFCNGQNVVLSVNSETGFTYQWLKDNTAITDATLATYTATDSGDYSVLVSSTIVSCNIDTEVVTVSTFPPPDVLFTFSGTQCATNDIQFTDQSTLLTEFTSIYNWDFGDGATSTEINPIYAFDSAADYTIQLNISYDGQNCVDTESQIISISEPTPFTITVTGETQFCQGGSSTLSIPDTFATFNWNTGETTAEITVDTTGTYSVTATNIAGCPSVDQIDITVFDLPSIIITPDSIVIQQGDTVQLEASGATTYAWTPGESLSDSTVSNPVASPLLTTIYSVTGTDNNDCIDNAEVTVKVDTESGVLPVQAPKLFSPNADGIDDEWVIAGILNFPECQIVVFGRSGTTVLEAQPYNNNWDGIFNGDPLPEGAYYYVISCPDGRKSTGSISIIR